MAAPVQASLTTSLTGAQNDLKYVSKWDATKGNATTVSYLDPGGTTHEAKVLVDKPNFHIIVVLRRAAGAIAMTAAEVVAAIRANEDASDLVDVQIASSNDGTGVVTALAATALSSGVDSAIADQTEAETIFRTINWASSDYRSERILAGSAQRIRTTGTAAVHRAALDKWYNDLARRGRILETN